MEHGELVVSAQVWVPGRPKRPWAVACPYCRVPKGQSCRIDMDGGESYKFTYCHQGRKDALAGAQKMWDEITEGIKNNAQAA